MPRLLIIFGLIAFTCILSIQIGSYFDGLEFQKSWKYPLLILPIGLISVLCFLFFSIATIVSVARKKEKKSSLLLIAVFPILLFASKQISIPSFLDGMHDAIESKLNREKLTKFAELARENGVDLTDPDFQKELANYFNKLYPEAMTLSLIQPRVNVSEDFVSIYYGSALTKHWGYTIVVNDECPMKHIPEELCRKVYDNVWVYEDIW